VQPLESVIDRTGFRWAELTWESGELVALRVPGAMLHRASLDHPLLGRAALVTTEAGEPLTVMSAIDWARPTEIPAIAEPGRLPAGAGGVILNVLALLAVSDRSRTTALDHRTGVADRRRSGELVHSVSDRSRTNSDLTALRYAGPWPTSALYQSLMRSFRTTASEAEFAARAMERALSGARDVLPFEFFPAPHERIAIARGHVEIRDGLERAVIDGIGYARDGGVTRLVGDRAEVWFGDERWAEVATFAADGSLVDGPHPIPACTSDAVGKAFPPALREAIAELVAEAVPAPLAAAARARVTTGPITWADLGARAARREGEGFAVHAALWQRLAPQGLARVALAIAEALVPVVTVAAARDVALMSPLSAGGAMVKP